MPRRISQTESQQTGAALWRVRTAAGGYPHPAGFDTLRHLPYHAGDYLRRCPLSVLSHQQIKALIESPEPLVSGYADLDAQLQANGFDMTLGAIAAYDSAGRIGVTNAERQLPDARELNFDAEGYVELSPGPYLVTLNEAVHLPDQVMAFGKPRSSLLRSGVAVHNAVWDAGYQGRSQALMVVYNRAGFRVARGARILQLVFLTLDVATAVPYAGQYQGERLSG